MFIVTICFTYEPRCGNILKPGCTATENGHSFTFRILEVEGLYYIYSEIKGGDQLRIYCAADLRYCFRICEKQVFSVFSAVDVTFKCKI